MTNPRFLPCLNTTLVLALTAAAAYPQTPAAQAAPVNGANGTPGCTLRIHVDGLRNSKGNLGTALFASADGWPEDTSKAFRVGPAQIPAGERQATATWEHLPPGDYGVVAIHDENSNARLDRNFLGIPREGFGFANNPRAIIGAPAFHQAVVHVGCPVTETTIHIQYR